MRTETASPKDENVILVDRETCDHDVSTIRSEASRYKTLCNNLRICKKLSVSLSLDDVPVNIKKPQLGGRGSTPFKEELRNVVVFHLAGHRDVFGRASAPMHMLYTQKT
jgi:hypothetical protein